jgi:drug/metabolite transporter (DMT)-like permease
MRYRLRAAPALSRISLQRNPGKVLVSDVPPHGSDRAGKAKLLLVLLSLAWGFSWPVMMVALAEVTPWTLRVLGYANGTLCMFALAKLRGRSARLPFGLVWAHVVVSALLTIVGFGLLSTFAQLSALTSRVAIVTYSMPIWASLLAWLILGERLNAMSIIGLVLCVGGVTVLIYPLATMGIPLGLLLALGAALTWAAGTVYLKWAQMRGDGIVITAWQLAVSFVVLAGCVAVFEGTPHLWPLRPATVLALAFHGLIATGLAYFLWFDIVGRLPAATASLGSLCVPVVGILSSMVMLGERPTFTDAVGFALILAAAACVLIAPTGGRHRSKIGER